MISSCAVSLLKRSVYFNATALYLLCFGLFKYIVYAGACNSDIAVVVFYLDESYFGSLQLAHAGEKAQYIALAQLLALAGSKV